MIASKPEEAGGVEHAVVEEREERRRRRGRRGGGAVVGREEVVVEPAEAPGDAGPAARRSQSLTLLARTQDHTHTMENLSRHCTSKCTHAHYCTCIHHTLINRLITWLK
jgi:hypothetical protein